MQFKLFKERASFFKDNKLGQSFDGAVQFIPINLLLCISHRQMNLELFIALTHLYLPTIYSKLRLPMHT